MSVNRSIRRIINRRDVAGVREARWRRRFWREFTDAEARLAADPVALRGLMDETAAWDSTLLDGLHDEFI